MTRPAIVLRLLAAVVLVGCAVVLVLLARDGWHWGRAMADADTRATLQPIAPGAWSADTTLPNGFVRDTLGIDDDLAYRSAVLGAIRLLDGVGTGGKQHIVIETALARIVLTDRNHVRASRAADYLGVLLYDDRSAPQQAISPYVKPGTQGTQPSEQTPEEKARTEFETAVRLDPHNADAKKNLELMLRQAKPPSQKSTPKPGGGERVGSKGSGSRAPGFGY